MLYKLEQLTIELISLNREIIRLTKNLNNGCKNNIRSLRLRGIILQSRKSGQAAGTATGMKTGSWNRQTAIRPSSTASVPSEPYLAANRRTEKPVIHISLNPHPDDVLTDEQLTAIGQEYMEKNGIWQPTLYHLPA